ncbi:MAG TPA: phosphoribosylglycinamide formyltransferase [Nitrososphaerales archaeon]|nr:phosphoribosylglycinamide formyltransferase [Nitrososphaerales archaeon]
MRRFLPIGLLVSGRGSTLESIDNAIKVDNLPVRVMIVISDRAQAPAVNLSRQLGFQTVVLPFQADARELWATDVTHELVMAGVELVVLAGLRSILPPGFVREWEGRVINVHPSLLPKFGGKGMYGPRVHEAVLRAGEHVTGATVHIVTEEVDAGPILAQATVEVIPGDTPETLERRLRPVQRSLYIDIIRQFAEGKLPLPWRRPGS